MCQGNKDFWRALGGSWSRLGGSLGAPWGRLEGVLGAMLSQDGAKMASEPKKKKKNKNRKTETEKVLK